MLGRPRLVGAVPSEQAILRQKNQLRELVGRGLARILPAPEPFGRLGMEELRAGSRRYAFAYRVNSRGDRGVVRQIFRRADYDITKWKQGRGFGRYFSAGAPTGEFLVVDAGANIGAAAVYFQLAYPGCRVLAIEPEKLNCDLLRKNTSGLSVEVFEAAIGGEEATLYLRDLGRSDWGFQVAESGLYPVNVLTVDQILTHHARNSVPLIMKIDIEGGEGQLFGRSCSWLESFPLVIVELHDWMFPGEGVSRSFYRQISEFDFDIVQKGENTFCFNNKILGQYY